MRRHLRQYGGFWIVGFCILGIVFFLGMGTERGFAQQAAGEAFFSWTRGGLKDEVDQLRADHDQLRAEYDALALKVETVTSAAAFSMGYQVERHQSLNNADFPVGHTLQDPAGNWHTLTQEHKDALITATAKAEALYTALTTP